MRLAVATLAPTKMKPEQTFDTVRIEGAHCDVCPLNLVKAGVEVRVRQICAAPEVQNRLREIGFCEDQIIRLLTSHTNLICQVCNARLAISEQLAKLILVEPVLRPAMAKP
jgi:Fe2+ transport system protein FeoA